MNLLGAVTQESGPQRLIVTEFVDGGDANDWLYRGAGRTSSLKTRLRLCLQLAKTMAFLHSQGMLSHAFQTILESLSFQEFSIVT